jgi:hypothetical protein
MSAQNRTGALSQLLAPFSDAGVSMTRLESRPARHTLWEYVFFVDVDGHRDDAPVADGARRARSPGALPEAPGFLPGGRLTEADGFFRGSLDVTSRAVITVCPGHFALSAGQADHPTGTRDGSCRRADRQAGLQRESIGHESEGARGVLQAIGGLARYPDDFALKQALAERTGLGEWNIVLGNGSNDVLDLVARVFLAPGRSAVFPQYAFAVYPLATLAAGGEPIAVAARDHGHDLDAMRAAIRPDTRLLWIANPNNPTGTFVPYPQLRTFLQSLPAEMSSSCSTRPTTSTCLPPSAWTPPPGWRRCRIW